MYVFGCSLLNTAFKPSTEISFSTILHLSWTGITFSDDPCSQNPSCKFDLANLTLILALTLILKQTLTQTLALNPPPPAKKYLYTNGEKMSCFAAVCTCVNMLLTCSFPADPTSQCYPSHVTTVLFKRLLSAVLRAIKTELKIFVCVLHQYEQFTRGAEHSS